MNHTTKFSGLTKTELVGELMFKCDEAVELKKQHELRVQERNKAQDLFTSQAQQLKITQEALKAKDNRIDQIEKDIICLSRLLKIIKATANGVNLEGEDRPLDNSNTFTISQVG